MCLSYKLKKQSNNILYKILLESIQIKKEDEKKVFTDCVIGYIENSEDFQKIPTITEFSKVQEYKFNIQNWIALL